MQIAQLERALSTAEHFLKSQPTTQTQTQTQTQTASPLGGAGAAGGGGSGGAATPGGGLSGRAYVESLQVRGWVKLGVERP